METRTLLRDRLRRSRDWAQTIDELEKELEGTGTKPEQSESLFELAALTEEVVPERERALALYQRAWKLFPDNLKALSRAREVYGEIGRFEMVAKLGEMELRHPAAAADLAALVGEAMLDSGQKEKAQAALSRALERTPDSVRVKDAIAALSYDSEFWTDDVDRLTSDYERFDSAAGTRMLLRAARILRLEAPEDPRLEGIVRKILDRDLHEPSANYMLEVLLANAQRWDDLEAHQLRRAGVTETGGAFAEALYRDVPARQDHAGDVGLLFRFGLEWVQRFKDKERGARFFARALARAASNGVTELKSTVAGYALLQQVLGAREQWGTLVEMAEQLVERAPPEARLYIGVAAGTIAFDKLGDTERARRLFRAAHAVEPRNEAVLDFVAAVGLSDSAEPEAAPAAAGVAEAAPAAPAAPTAAPAAPTPAPAAGGAEPIAAPAPEPVREEPPAIKPVAAAPAAAPPPAAKPAPAAPAARVAIPADLDAGMEAARAAEGGPDRGVAAWKEVIARHPSDPAPRRELARVLRAMEAWAQLAEALRDEESKAAPSSPDKAVVFRELAEVYQRLGNENQVISALQQSIANDPSQTELYDQLCGIYEAKKRWTDLVKVLGEKAERVHGTARAAIYLQVANVYLERFSNQGEAIKAFERVLEADPADVVANTQLLGLYEKRREWEKYLTLRQGEIERSPEHERAAKVIEVAKIAATKVKKPEVCTVWWEMVVQVEPTHEEALTELAKLYDRSREWDKLADICSKQADIAPDDKTRVEALQRLGLLYTEKVENSGKAIEAWRRLLAIDENNRRAQDALKKLYVTEGRWDDLEEFYRGRGKVDEYIRVLEREVEAGSEQHRLPLAIKIAVLYRDEIGKPDRATRAFEKVLSLDEHNLEAAEALIPLYEAGRDPRRLAAVLEIQLGATAEPSVRQDRLKRLAEFHEEKLRDKGAAFSWWLRAHAEDHAAEWIRTEVERLAQETGAWGAVIDAYTASLPKFSHKADALPLMLVLARLVETEQGDIDRALEINREILAIDDRNEQALGALERLYSGKGQFTELLDVYERKLDLVSDVDERVRIQQRIGQLYEDELRDDKKAIGAYMAILDAVGDEPQALGALDRIFVRNQMWPELADALTRQLTVVSPDEDRERFLELKYRLGEVRERHLGKVEDAIEAYRDVVEIDALHGKSRAALERHLADASATERRLTAASILEPAYEQLGEWGKLIEVHEIQLAAEKDDLLRKTTLLLSVGKLWRTKLGDAEKAFDAFARGFAVDPSTEEAKAQLEELAPLCDDGWARLVGLFSRALAEPGKLDPVLAHELASKVARMYEERLGDSDQAVAMYRRALSIEPEDTAALTALEAIFTRGGKYAELLEVYRRRVEISTEPEERLGFLQQIATIHEDMLQAPEDAIGAYLEILGQRPDEPSALRALDRLYVARGQWHDLSDNLSRQLTLIEDDGERVPLLVRLAQLRETHLGEPGAAVETYRQVLDFEPQNPDAVAALERLIASSEHELAIATILEPIYQSRGDWQNQIRVYEIMARHAYDPVRKIELMHHIAELYEIGGDDAASAFATHARALREDPRHDTTHAHLERLSRLLGKWDELAALYAQVADDAQEEDLKVSLLFRRAQIEEGELGDDARAVATYERVLAISPVAVDAVTAIQAIHERTGDRPALVSALKRKAEILTEPQERKNLLYQAAELEEEQGATDAAIETYQAVLKLDEGDGIAVDALERMYVNLERWEPLKDIYARKADLASDPHEKKQMLYVLAQVYDRELGDLSKAIETYQAILDIDADELPAIQSLDRLYGQAERWYDLLGILERQVELAESGGETVGLKYRIGQLWQLRLSDVARAIESYSEALAVDPSHRETLDALDHLVRGKVEPVLAARVLEPIYDASSEHVKLAHVLEVMVTHAEEPAARIELLHRIAALQEQRIGNATAAFDAYCRALRDDSSNELSLGHLERLAEITGSWQALAGLLAAEAEKSLDVPRQVDLWARLARIYEHELADAPRAIATYRRILDAEFDNREAVHALDRLFSQSGAWQDLVGVLKREIQLAETDEENLGLQFRLGQTFEERLGDRKAAVEAYRDILSAEPTHRPTIDALERMFHAGHMRAEVGAVLEPLYEGGGEFEKLHDIYHVQLEALQGPERQAMYQRLAELAEQRLLDEPRAFGWWGQAVIEDARWDHAVEECERLSRRTGGWDDMVAVYTRALERADDKDLQRATLLRLARVHEAELGDPANAVATHLRVLEVAPTDADALAALDRLYAGAGMYEDLSEILRRRIDVTTDPDEQLELYFRRGAIQSDALDDLDAALATYDAVLQKDSHNRRALEAAEQIHFRRQDWPKLYATYEKLTDLANDSELADLYARMARISSDALGDEAKAIDLLTRVLDIRGEDAQALAALADLTERQGRWEELVELIERQVAVAQEPAEQIALYKHMGRVWADKLGRERNALDAWLAADRLDGQDLETLRALAELYRSTQSWEELSQTLRRIIEVGSTGSIHEDEIIELYAQLGQLEGGVLGRIDEAVDAWRRVVALDPTDFRALGALEDLFTREARWEDAIEVMDKRALVLEDEDQRRQTLLQMAATWEEKVENLTEAAAVYEKVRQSDPTNPVASEHLESIYRAQFRWNELVEVLLERSEVRPDVDEQIAILNQVAKIYESELGEQEAAFVVLQAAFKRDYGHNETARELERLATATNRWQELLDEYTNRVKELEREDRAAAADLWVKIGRWYGEHLAHLEWAIHSVQQALRIDPSHPAALELLADLQRKRGSWHELVETLQRHAVVQDIPAAKRTELYVQLAELREQQIQDLGGAIQSYQQALRYDDACRPALAALDRLYRRTEQWELLIEVLTKRAELEHEERDQIRIKLEIGQIYDLRLHERIPAIAAYQQVLEIDPGNLGALRALETLYEATDQPEKYLEVLEAQLDVSGSDAERVALYERMSAAWEEKFRKLDRAAECLEKIVALDERNFSAYRELARIYQQAGKWEALVETYRNHIASTSDVPTRIDLYCAMGSVYDAQLGDSERAIEAYTDVLSFDPYEARALDALGRLYERISEWDRAVESMAQLTRNVEDPRQQVELFCRMGKIQYGQLHDADSAEANFLRGLALDGSHVPTMESLVKLYRDRGDWLKAAQMMVRAEGYTPVVLDKVRLLYDAARIYQEKLQQPDAAKQLYAAVISLDPEHVDAGRPLAELYFQRQEWAELSPVLDMLVRKIAQTHPDPRELNELYFRAAKTADELGDYQKSLAYYRAAYDIDATYLPTLTGRADLLFKMQDWDGAGKIFQTILVQHRDSLAEQDVVRIYNRLGMVRQALGERKKALNMFEKALEIDPTHRETLQAVIDLQQAQGDWEAVVHAKRGLMATGDAAERTRLLDEIGGIYHERLANPQKATAAYNEALAISPADHQLLQKLLDLYSETKQWKKVVEVIERFIELETDPLRRGPYYQAAATICRDELKAIDEALELYNKALDSYFQDPKRLNDSLMQRVLKAFEAINKVLTEKKDWKAQERACRDMIKRLPREDEHPRFHGLRVKLLDGLGEIYRSRLKHYRSATEVFQLAQTLDPENKLRDDGLDRAEILAELYLVAGPEYAERAVEQHMRMLRINPFKFDSYKALRRIYAETNQYDKIWCVCNTLAFLKKADEEELQFYEQHKPRGMVKAKAVMSADVWSKVFHPDENRYISAIFASVWPAIAAIKAHTHKDHGLKRKDKLPLPGDLLFSKVFEYAAKVLGVMVPEVFLVNDGKTSDIQFANLIEKDQLIPSVVVRPNLMQNKGERELAFLSARRLAYLRPEYFLKLALSSNTELKAAMLAAIVMVQPRFQVPPDIVPAVQAFVPEIQRRVQPHMLEQLQQVVARFIKDSPEINLAQWGFTVDYAAARAGFVVSGDLEVAARVVSAEPTVVGGPQVNNKVADLVLYSISEEYFAVRAALGLGIG